MANTMGSAIQYLSLTNINGYDLSEVEWSGVAKEGKRKGRVGVGEHLLAGGEIRACIRHDEGVAEYAAALSGKKRMACKMARVENDTVVGTVRSFRLRKGDQVAGSLCERVAEHLVCLHTELYGHGPQAPEGQARMQARATRAALDEAMEGSIRNAGKPRM